MTDRMPSVLIVEDNCEMREMIKFALIKRKYTVFEAENGKEAILKFKPTLTDMVITDLLMPDEDGLAVIMKLKQIKPELRVIAISGGGKVGPGSYLSIAKTLGADAIFHKPFSTQQLCEKVDELMVKV